MNNQGKETELRNGEFIKCVWEQNQMKPWRKADIKFCFV